MASNRIAHLFPACEMPRREKPVKVQLGTLISEDLMGQLQDYHDDTGLPITVIVEKALSAYFVSQYRSGHAGDDDSPETRKGRK